jgi:hypothetical protein
MKHKVIILIAQSISLLFHIEQAPRHGMDHGWHGFSDTAIN